jgi:hypothetical protein
MTDSNSIFISQRELDNNNISGKITCTNILETIPDESITYALDPDKWKTLYKTEWRWRFLQLPKDRLIVEISYLNSDGDNKRIYFNKSGNWVNRIIDPIYDNYVVKQYFYYSN